jgi:hypothetical protein
MAARALCNWGSLLSGSESHAPPPTLDTTHTHTHTHKLSRIALRARPSGRDLCGRGLRQDHGQGGRVHRHVGPGRDQPGDRAGGRHDGQRAARGHHGPGASTRACVCVCVCVCACACACMCACWLARVRAHGVVAVCVARWLQQRPACAHAHAHARAPRSCADLLAPLPPKKNNTTTTAATHALAPPQVPRKLIGTDGFQETPIVEVTRAITKHNYLVMDVEDLPRVIKEVRACVGVCACVPMAVVRGRLSCRAGGCHPRPLGLPRQQRPASTPCARRCQTSYPLRTRPHPPNARTRNQTRPHARARPHAARPFTSRARAAPALCSSTCPRTSSSSSPRPTGTHPWPSRATCRACRRRRSPRSSRLSSRRSRARRSRCVARSRLVARVCAGAARACPLVPPTFPCSHALSLTPHS